VAGAAVVVGTSTEVEVEEAVRVALTRVVEIVDDDLLESAAAAVVVAALVATAVVWADPD
jgi:hypothetical protein